MNRISTKHRSGLAALMAWILLAAAILGLATAVYAGPQGAKVIRGHVQFTQQGDTLIIRASNKSIINFSSFSIPAGETVRFVLPSASSRILARDTGGNLSQIDGALLCNGRLYLVNYAGVTFGPTSLVNTATLTAVAGNITDHNFARNVDRFSGIAGSVTNAGTLQAQSVHLIGRQVTNSGAIVAPGGVVTMTAASGEVFLGERDGHVLVMISAPAAAPANATGTPPLTSAGPTNPLAVGDMYSLAVQNSGQVTAREVAIGGTGAKVDVSGSIDASQSAGRGGTVGITGQQISLTNAVVNASGQTGGGEIQVIATAANPGNFAKSNVFISADSLLSASATSRGDGGHILVKSDDNTVVNGDLVARGGPNGGTGGFVETSGGILSVAQAPDVSAAKGRGGTWLLDPHDIEIVDSQLWSINDAAANGYDVTSGANLTLSPSAASPAVSQLPLSVILAGMKRAETVIVQTSPGGGKGDITWTMSSVRDLNMATLRTDAAPGDFRRLILRANNNINIDFFHLLNVEQGHLQLVLVPNYDHKGGGHVYSFTYATGEKYPIAVPPDAPNMSLKDIVIQQAASPRPSTPPTNSDVPEPSSGENGKASQSEQSDRIENRQDVSQAESVQLKAAESGAMDTTNAVSIRRASEVTSQPSMMAGDAVGLGSLPR